MNLEQFDEFTKLVLDHMDDYGRDEWYDTEHNVAEALLSGARHKIFGETLAKEERYQTYMKLKAEFEGEQA